MKKLTTILAAIAICLGISINGFAQKVAPVYLNVQIDDSIGQQSNGGIGSDNLTSGTDTYVHGTQSVTAAFTQYGFFTFNSGTRFVKAYYSSPLYDSLTLPTPTDSSQGVKITTHNNSTYAQNMTVGQVLCMALSVNIPVVGYSRIIGYHAGHGTLTNTSYVKVTRLPNNFYGKGVWTIESNSQGTCISSDGMVYDNTARIRDAKTSNKPAPEIDYGRYNMPFKLTLTGK